MNDQNTVYFCVQETHSNTLSNTTDIAFEQKLDFNIIKKIYTWFIHYLLVRAIPVYRTGTEFQIYEAL